MKVIARPGESAESIIRRFTRVMMNDNILAELKEKEYYKKPSEIRYRKGIERLRKLREAAKRQRQHYEI